MTGQSPAIERLAAVAAEIGQASAHAGPGGCRFLAEISPMTHSSRMLRPLRSLSSRGEMVTIAARAAEYS